MVSPTRSIGYNIFQFHFMDSFARTTHVDEFRCINNFQFHFMDSYRVGDQNFGRCEDASFNSILWILVSWNGLGVSIVDS